MKHQSVTIEYLSDSVPVLLGSSIREIIINFGANGCVQGTRAKISRSQQFTSADYSSCFRFPGGTNDSEYNCSTNIITEIINEHYNKDGKKETHFDK